MNPRNDYVFHRLFGYKGNEEITSGLISEEYIREEDFRKIVLTDTLEIHIIKLPKLIKQLEENKGIRKDKVTLWSMFILNPENLGDEIMSENEDIKKAKEELERIKLNEQDQRLAELRMKYILDQNAIRNSGFREGKEAGLQEGKEIGLQEGKEIGLQEGKEIGLQEGKEIGLQDGKKAEKFEIAKKLIALKMPISQIIQITALTEEEIKQIQ